MGVDLQIALAGQGEREAAMGRDLVQHVIVEGDAGVDFPRAVRVEIDGDRVTIGASATMAAVARRPELAFLAQAARAVGGPAVRNMATVGGNLFAPPPYGDFGVALLALDAVAALGGSTG